MKCHLTLRQMRNSALFRVSQDDGLLFQLVHSSSWNLWLLAIKTACILEHNLYVYIVSNFMMMKYQLVNTHLISFFTVKCIVIVAWYSRQFFIRILKFLLFNNIFIHISLKNSILLLINCTNIRLIVEIKNIRTK